MKKHLILTGLCLMGAVSSYGQGTISFQNSDFGSFNVLAHLNSLVGPTLGSSYVAQLTYSVDNGATFVALTLPSQIGVFGFGFAADNDATFGGIFSAGIVTLANVNAGNAGNVKFQVLAWQGNNASTYQGATVKGASGIFSSTAAKPVATGQTPAGDMSGYGWQPWFVTASVPEPGTLALAGLGAAGLLLFRRRK